MPAATKALIRALNSAAVVASQAASATLADLFITPALAVVALLGIFVALA
jgi:hypothetical protein